MTRILVGVGLSVAVALFAALPLSGQSNPNPPLVMTAYNGGPGEMKPNAQCSMPNGCRLARFEH
jgi:hypothetical protein